MELVALFGFWMAFVVWTATIIGRANIPTTGERILWYFVMFSMPIAGTLLIWFRFGRREPKTKNQPLDIRMTAAIADLHGRTNVPNKGYRSSAESKTKRNAT